MVLGGIVSIGSTSATLRRPVADMNDAETGPLDMIGAGSTFAWL